MNEAETCQVDVPVCRGDLAVSQQVAQDFQYAVCNAMRAPGAPKALVHLWAPPQPPASSPGDVIGLPRLQETLVLKQLHGTLTAQPISGNGSVLRTHGNGSII